MNTKHAKSQCCQARIHRFGHRRRQCSFCKKTWSIRPKKRGRLTIRISPKILSRVFLEGYPLHHLAERCPGVSLLNFRHRFRQALNRFLARPSSREISPGPLTLLADGLWFHFQNKPWVLYLTALKACSDKTAIFLDPLLFPGKEGSYRWREVFSAIPPELRTRIRALVVDNLQGMKRISKHEGWVLQLCHFHLLIKLQIQRGHKRITLKGGRVREDIYQMIHQALHTSEESTLETLLAQLTHLTETSCGTQRIRAVVQEFIQSVKYYRAYLTHPELNLPATTNTVESMCSIIRDLFRRNRSASSPQSLLRWATALIRLRQKLVCNGKNHQQI